jgi:cytochrome c biogenesis factor
MGIYGEFRSTQAGRIIQAMRRIRWLMFAIAIVLFLACVRIRYQKLGWGGYWSVDLVAPWRR